MRRVHVKICGITRKEDLDAAVEAGADSVGFVVGIPSSARNISTKKAEELVGQVPPCVESILVIAPQHADELVAFARLNPSALQIHGANMADSEIRKTLPRMRLIRAVKADTFAVAEAWEATKTFDAVLLDTFTGGRCGGTGATHNWGLSGKVRQSIHPTPLILAGGLNPENVATAVRTVQPYGVDVSSGVELRPGIKDFRKMVDFVKNAKEVEI